MDGRREEFYIKFSIGERVFLKQPEQTYKLHTIAGYKYIKLGERSEVWYFLEDGEGEWESKDLCGERDMGKIFKPDQKSKT
jgi:hypothetical protein